MSSCTAHRTINQSINAFISGNEAHMKQKQWSRVSRCSQTC